MTESSGSQTHDDLPQPEVETPAPFEVGQIVYLKGRYNIKLVVEGQFTLPNDPSTWIVGVVWFDDSAHVHRAQFPAATLEAKS